MALKNRADPASIRAALAAWLPAVLGGGPVEVSNLEMPSASGMSSETILLDASWRHDGRQVDRGLVVRIPPAPGEGLLPDADLARELRVMRVLAEHTDAPIPAVLAHETTGSVLGAPFALLDRAYGEVPGDDPPFVTGGWVVDLEPWRRATLYDEAVAVVAAIQRVDPERVGLADLAHGELGDTVLDQEWEYWRRCYGWAAGDRRSPTIEAAFDALARTRPDGDGPLVVSWGDARLGNLMFGPDQRVTGMFDWEMASLGRPEVDLGYFLFFDRLYSSGLGLPRLEGFPDREATVRRFSERSGHAVHDLDWFEAWAALRGAILLLRVGSLMIEAGQLPADAPMPLNNPASQVLAALLDLPAPDGEAGWITGHR